MVKRKTAQSRLSGNNGQTPTPVHLSKAEQEELTKLQEREQELMAPVRVAQARFAGRVKAMARKYGIDLNGDTKYIFDVQALVFYPQTGGVKTPGQ